MGALKTVAEYSQTGFVRYLPNMNQGRYHHACSSFVNGNGETVLLVTGGLTYPSGQSVDLDSTETLVLEDTEWRTLPTARLPSPRNGLRAAALENKVFLFGGSDRTSALSTIH